MGATNNPRSLPAALDYTLADVAEHMRGDALSYMARGGPDDCIGQWLWDLAERIAEQAKENQ